MTDAPMTRVLYVGPAFEQVWGFPRERMFEDAFAFRQFIHPDDRVQALKNNELMKEGRAPEWDEEFRIIRPDGQVLVADGSHLQAWPIGVAVADVEIDLVAAEVQRFV